MFLKASHKINHDNLLNIFKKLLRLKRNSDVMMRTLSKIYQKKTLLFYSTFIKTISIKIFDRYQRIGQATEKINKLIKKISVKNLIKALGIPYFSFCKVLDKLYLKKLSNSFQHIDMYGKQRKKLK